MALRARSTTPDAKVGGMHKASFTNFTTGKSHAYGGQAPASAPDVPARGGACRTSTWPRRHRIVVATRDSAQETVNQVAQQITRRNLSIQPTLTIRPGFPMRVMVNKDLVLRPYQPLFFQRV
jgi:hypothetical protein